MTHTDPVEEHLLGTAALVAAAALAVVVVVSNLLVSRVGLVEVWPGVLAPAAVLTVGVALVVRDVVHDLGGWRLAVAAVLVGSLLSLLVAPAFALASAVAYLLGQLLDAAVYAPLRAHGFAVAAVVSSLIGAVLDSLAFLWLSPLGVDLLLGQLIGKGWGVVLAVLVVLVLRPRRAR